LEEKSLTTSHVNVTGQCQGHFSEGSRLLGKNVLFSRQQSNFVPDGFSF